MMKMHADKLVLYGIFIVNRTRRVVRIGNSRREGKENSEEIQ